MSKFMVVSEIDGEIVYTISWAESPLTAMLKSTSEERGSQDEIVGIYEVGTMNHLESIMAQQISLSNMQHLLNEAGGDQR
ncbi:hypothetical protein MFLO_15603 [Listeria floridensis FSL S10-1187]|uniref:Uncharacterized protein n=1 Tax=Listeria floridensis FSL S10-1187 TaxID=1265817 RepID=A0ABN0RBD6_9LIST|nr:hypothetical protein [Listeria floridensis]EUJ25078.1 hypothetical protein MFLO_15603 [Listeria floridensis FSL S10-1187]